MVTVLHAFPERDLELQAAHLRYWHGTIRSEHVFDEDDQHPIVCWCGGRRYNMGPETCVVWHTDEFTPILLVDGDDDDVA